jgi:starch-binding outer membrane protein, SusD/RagB family
MKKHILKSILAISLIVALGACEDVLDQAPISSLGSNGYFRNANDFNYAVAGAYSTLRTHPQRQFDLFEVRSDNIYASGIVRDYTNINNFVTTLATTPYIAAQWNDNYSGVTRVNTVLDKITPELIGDDALYNQYVGEMKFLRALFYFDLVRTYGAVPKVDKLVSHTEALELGRSAPTEIYDELIIPATYSGADVGRATSWAAKALLARVYLTRSGPDYGIEGPGLNSNEYGEALALLTDIVNNGPYAWVDNYASIFSYDNENNPDIVFDVQLASGGAGSEYPALMYPQYYGQDLGIPYAGGVPPDSPKEVSLDLINSYEADDVRLDVVMTEGWTNPTNGLFVANPFVSKFVDLDVAMSLLERFDFPINFPIIRYTDVLMMRAEALIKTGGSQTEVDAIVNDVRTRAGVSTLSNVTYEQLMEERRREFAGEALRWHDLVRSGLVKTEMDAWLPTEDSNNTMPETLDVNHIIYPVPFNQIDVKVGLYQQNTGYL